MRKSEEEDGETFESSAYSWDDLEFVDTLDDGTAHTGSLQTISTLKSSVSEDYYSDDNFESLANDSTKEIFSETTTEVTTENIEEIKAKEQFLTQKIYILTNKPLGVNHVVWMTEQGVQSEEYNANKIRFLQSKFKSKNEQKLQSTDQSPIPNTTKKVLKNTRKLQQLKIENAIFEVEKKIASPLHQPKKCKTCRQLQSKLNENEYIKRKTAQLSKQQFSDDLEKHLYQKDSVTLIADIINSGPKSSAPPQEIWDRLLKKGKYSC